MSAVGVTLLLLCLNVCLGHDSYDADEMLKKVVEMLNILVKDKKYSPYRAKRSASGTVCPDTWIRYRGSCYLFPNGTFNFNDAEYMCTQHGSHLVHIESDSENTFLKNLMRGLKDSDYWTGLVDPEQKGTWTWHGTGTEALFTDWSSHSPNNFGGSQYCVKMQLSNDFIWNDWACTDTCKAVCEKNMAN